MAKKTNKLERSWVVMFFAGLLWLMGAVIAVIGIANYSALGWWTIPIVASGLSSICFSSLTIVTGKPEWILLDLLLPG